MTHHCFLTLYIYIYIYIYIYNVRVCVCVCAGAYIHMCLYICFRICLYILKLADTLTYLSSNVSSTESNVSIHLAKAWTAIDRLSIIWKSDLSDKIKRDFFQAAVMSILLYGCTLMLTRRVEKKQDGNCTRMLRVKLNKSWKQHPRNNSCTAFYLPSLKPSK